MNVTCLHIQRKVECYALMYINGGWMLCIYVFVNKAAAIALQNHFYYPPKFS